MAFTYVTEQSYPAAATPTDLYTAPTVVVSRMMNLTIANNSATADVITVHQIPGGGSSANENLIVPAFSLSGNNILQETTPRFLNTGDIIRIESTNGTSAFTISVIEETT